MQKSPELLIKQPGTPRISSAYFRFCKMEMGVGVDQCFTNCDSPSPQFPRGAPEVAVGRYGEMEWAVPTVCLN